MGYGQGTHSKSEMLLVSMKFWKRQSYRGIHPVAAEAREGSRQQRELCIDRKSVV